MKRVRIHFKDQGQDFLNLEAKSVGTYTMLYKIVAATFPVLTEIYAGKFIDIEKVKVGEKLEIYDFKNETIDTLDYEVERIEEIDQLTDVE